MVYPNFLRNTYKLRYEKWEISETDYIDFYSDFVTHYLNRHVFIRLTNGSKVWYDWNRHMDVTSDEKEVLNKIFNLTQPTFLLPTVTDSQKNEASILDFLEDVLEIMMDGFPLYSRNDWALQILSKKSDKNKLLTKEARELIFDSVVSFSPPVLWDGDEVPNFLVGLLKTISTTPVLFNSYELYEHSKVRQLVEERLGSHKVYGYRSHETADRAADFTRAPILHSDVFFKKWEKYVRLVPWSVKNRIKMNLIPSIRNSYHKLVIVSGSMVTATAGAALAFPTASAAIVGGVVGTTTVATAGTGLGKLMRHIPDADKGWLVLTAEGEQLVRQIEAWERFKDSTGDTANLYSTYKLKNTAKTLTLFNGKG